MLTYSVFYDEIAAMARKKKEEIKKPDVIISAFEIAFTYVRKNVRSFIIGLIIFFVAASAVYAYIFYDRQQDDKVQYQLSQGIKSFDAYSVNGKQEDLDGAESAFKNVISMKRKRLSTIAMLYLGKVHYIRGKNEEAKKVYQDIVGSTSDPVTKALAEKALEHINSK
jgi:predicted negative regulator of RcsB-dependent stress response